MIMLPAIVWNKYLFRRYSNLCGFTIPINVCEKGIALPHRGTIVINTTARIGENCSKAYQLDQLMDLKNLL